MSQPKDPSLAEAATPATEVAVLPAVRETIEICINGVPTIMYRDELDEQIYGALYAGLGLQIGG